MVVHLHFSLEVSRDNASYRGQPATPWPTPRSRHAAGPAPARRPTLPGSGAAGQVGGAGFPTPGVHKIELGFVPNPSPPCLPMDSGPPRAGLWVGLIWRLSPPPPPVAAREVKRPVSGSRSRKVAPLSDKNSAIADVRAGSVLRQLWAADCCQWRRRAVGWQLPRSVPSRLAPIQHLFYLSYRSSRSFQIASWLIATQPPG
ncbi:hypothetical protein B0G69_5672 [Paraburkholderia sp. RAU2J]|nr:hypothetical protein B0G69_5672 [Paraburkholderia sp. RAU2J]